MIGFGRWPISVMIFEPRSGGGHFVSQDKCGPRKRKGGVGIEYKLKKKKDVLEPQRYENFFIAGGKKRLLLLFSPSQGVYEPMTIDGFKLKALEMGWKENFMNNVQQAYIVFFRRGFMEKYMPLIMLIVFGFIMIMTLVVIRQDLFAIIDTVGEAVGSIGAVNAPLEI